MKNSERFTKYVNASIIYVVLLAIFLLAGIQFLRSYSSDILPGDQSYNILRYSEYFSDNSALMRYDSLSYSGRIDSYQQATPVIISGISSLTNQPVKTICKFLPSILGIVSLILFYFLVYSLYQNRKLATLSALFMAISPPFLYTFSVCNYMMFPIAITLLALLLLANKKQIFASIAICSLALFGTVYSLIGLSLFFINFILRKQNKTIFYSTLAIIFLLDLSLNLPLINSYGFPEFISFSIRESGLKYSFQNFLFELGGKFGISIFLILFSLSGLAMLWKNRKNYSNLYLALIIFIILSAYLIWPTVYLNYVFAILAALGFMKISSTKWESRLIRNSTITFLFLGLILSGYYQVSAITSSQPNQDYIDSLEYLNSESNPGDVVLSYYSNGYWIESISKRPVFMDSSFIYAPEVNERYEDSERIFHSRSIEEIKTLLDKNNIRYIWITIEMKQGQVWSVEDEGMLFLLRYNTKFKNVFSNEHSELWLVRPD